MPLPISPSSTSLAVCCCDSSMFVCFAVCAVVLLRARCFAGEESLCVGGGTHAPVRLTGRRQRRVGGDCGWSTEGSPIAAAELSCHSSTSRGQLQQTQLARVKPRFAWSLSLLFSPHARARYPLPRAAEARARHTGASRARLHTLSSEASIHVAGAPKSKWARENACRVRETCSSRARWRTLTGFAVRACVRLLE